jgi:hypothetical protein
MNCPVCGRFMKKVGECSTRHPTQEQKEQARALVEQARTENTAREATEVRSLFEAAQRSRIAR